MKYMTIVWSSSILLWGVNPKYECTIGVHLICTSLDHQNEERKVDHFPGIVRVRVISSTPPVVVLPLYDLDGFFQQPKGHLPEVVSGEGGRIVSVSISFFQYITSHGELLCFCPSPWYLVTVLLVIHWVHGWLLTLPSLVLLEKASK